MFTTLRHDWRQQFQMPASAWEYIAGFLLPADELLAVLTEDEAWAEVPCDLRNAILQCALLERYGRQRVEPETIARIAETYGVRARWILLSLGWLPGPLEPLDEMDKTILRLCALIDRPAHYRSTATH